MTKLQELNSSYQPDLIEVEKKPDILELKRQRYDLLIEKNSKKCRESFYQFFITFWNIVSTEDLIANWHIRYICDQLEVLGKKIANREPIEEDLIINVPPGLTKSTIVSIMFPVWLWLQRPSIVIISSSYSSGLSIDHSIKSKEVYNSRKFHTYFQKWIKDTYGDTMYLKKNTEKDWRNNFGGVRYATSTGGTVTGKHADVILRDDPLNPVQAASETERTNCNRYNDRTLSTRKKAKDRTLTVTVMQRLHEDDTTGHDLKKLGKKIFHICLPAELSAKTKALPEEVNKYYVNNLLDPTRLSKKILEAEYAEMRSYAYAGQYLQKPYPDEDGLVERNWFVYIDKSEIPRTLIWDLWIDGAYTDNKSANDPTGLMMCAWDMLNERLVVRHCKSDWLKFPELVKLIPEYYAEHGGDVTSTIYIEPKASGHDLINMIADETNITVVKIKGKLVEQGKAVRVNYAAPRIEAGKVHIVRDNWNEEFVTQLVAFPNYSHDEYCDLLGYALQKYINS